MNDLKLRFLSQEDVIAAGANDMKAAIADAMLAFSLLDRGDCVLPLKTSLRWGDEASEVETGRINSMPGYVGGEVDIAGIKWVGGSPLNTFRFGLPRASGVLILNDPQTMVPVAIMEAALISAIRTGAVSGVGALYLANSDSRVVGVIGAGVQARTQLLALKEAVPGILEVKAFDRDRQRLEKFCVEMSEMLTVPVNAVSDCQEAIEDTDIFVTAIVTNSPVVKDGWVPDGSFYIHVGSYECEFDVIQNSNRVVVDSWEAVVHRDVTSISKMHAAGLFSREQLYAEIGEIVNCRKPGRQSHSERIMFAPIGVCLHDLVIGARIYRRAMELGIGTELQMYEEPVWT